MKTSSKLLLILLGCLIQLSCKKEADEMPTSIDPSDVNTLSRFITLEEGAELQNGELPDPGNLISISSINNSITSSNGATASMVIRMDNSASNDISGYFINIDGSDVFYEVPLSSIPSSGFLTIPVGLPTVLQEGNFCINVMTYNSSGSTSNIVQQCVNVVRLGSGTLQINLAWDTDYTDIDLHVVDPSGFEIYYGDSYSYNTDGQLDRDDLSGFGPENIFWNENAPDGEYNVYVNYYEGNTPTKCFITVNGPNDSKSFTKVLNSEYDDIAFVTRVVKNGDRLTFHNNATARMASIKDKERELPPKK